MQVEKLKTYQKIQHKLTQKVKFLYKWNCTMFYKCLIGIILYSVGINLFVVPNGLYTGGILGIAQLFRTALFATLGFNIRIDISSILYYILNIVLLALSYRKLSKEFFNRTLLTVTLSSILLSIIPIPVKSLMHDTITNAIIGGIISGIGIGMVLTTGSSTGGTDIIGIVLIQNNPKVTVGSVGLVFNVIIYGICGILYGIEIMLYSIIYSVFETILTDKNHMQNIKSQTFIFTKKDPHEMIFFINHSLNRGVTFWKAEGGYTKTRTFILYTVLSKYERIKLERHMKAFDKDAFISASDGITVKGDFEKYLIE